MIKHIPSIIVGVVIFALGRASHDQFGGAHNWDVLACAALIMIASSAYTWMHYLTRFTPFFVWPIPAAMLMVVAYRILYRGNNASETFFDGIVFPEPSSAVSTVIIMLTLIAGYALNSAVTKAFPRATY